MSFKIFSFQLFGKIKPVEKIEMQRKILFEDYQEFLQVEKSEELSELIELEKQIQSVEFKNRKTEIQKLAFRGSKEDKVLKEFEKLKNAPHIKKYYKLKDSANLKRFEALKNSDKLNEYQKLADFVDNGDFRKVKENSSREVYKGSEEDKKEREFKKLKKSAGIKVFYELHQSEILVRHEALAHSGKLKKFVELTNLPEKDKEKKKELKNLKRDGEIKSYFKFEHSKKLKLYRDVVDSYNLKKFEELKLVVESNDFRSRVSYLKDKKKFERTEAFKKYIRFKELTSSDDIKFFKKFEKSPLLKNYYDVEESQDLKRFLELKEITASEDFLKRKAYLEDSKKWEKSEEYATEQKLFEMKKRTHIVKYFKYKGTDVFNFFKDWEVTFEDNFSGSRLDTKKWATVSQWAEKTLGRNYSLPGDLHIYTDGKNIKTDGRLVIETRREKSKGMVWQMPAGFVPAEFEYTSGLINSANSFWQEDGIFEAKIKFNPLKEVVSSFILQGEKNSPRLHLLEMGTKNRLGVASINGKGKVKVDGLDISNLKKGKGYIFSVEKSGGDVTWKINDTEVFKTEQRHIDFPLHMNLQSIVVDPVPGSKLPVRFQVEWVKCYKKI